MKRITGELVIQTGVIEDKPDERDYVASATAEEIPEAFTLRTYAPKVKSQGQAGSCTAHAAVTAYEIEAKVLGKRWFIEGSEQYNYYHSRVLGSLFPEDKGAYLRDACKVMAQRGNCPEMLSPYNAFDINREQGAFTDSFARFFKAQLYTRIIDIDTMKANIANGHPIMIGIPIYASFRMWGDPAVPMPAPGEKKLGRHAVVLLGYSDAQQSFQLFNSWDSNWGSRGYAWIPYAYLEQYGYDAWAFRL